MGIWHNLEQQIWMSDLFSGLIFSFLRRETWRKGLTWNTFFRFRGVKAKYVTVHPRTLSGQTRRTTVRIYPSHVCASHPSTTRARERSSFLLPPYLCPTLARVRGPSPPSDPEPMAAEPPADGRDPPADDGAAGDGAVESAAAEALLSAASEQLTLVYQGEVYVFDPVPPQKVAPFCTPSKNFFHRVRLVLPFRPFGSSGEWGWLCARWRGRLARVGCGGRIGLGDSRFVGDAAWFSEKAASSWWIWCAFSSILNVLLR